MLEKAAIYLDANAGAPLSPCVTEALLHLFQQNHGLANPSSSHAHGKFTRRLLSQARSQVAGSFGVDTDPAQIYFTSSGTEANQWVIRSVFEPRLAQRLPSHWITTEVEHDSNRQMVAWLKKQGGQVSYLPVDFHGRPQIDSLPDLITPSTALVSVIWVNNETGVITDVNRLAQLTQLNRLPLHLDGAQAWGKIPFQISPLGAQFVTFSAHKIGGLAGSAGLWISKSGLSASGGVAPSLQPLFIGKHEKGYRGGTENLFGAVAMGAAASQLDPKTWAAEASQLRDRLQNAVMNRIPGTQVNGACSARVPNTLNLSFDDVKGDELVIAMDLAGFSISSGSACQSGAAEPSHVLMAMGRSRAQARSSIRISFSYELLPWQTLAKFVDCLEESVIRIRAKTDRANVPVNHFPTEVRGGAAR